MPDSSQTATPDLTICDREPITRLDLIQSFGFLLAMSNDWTIARASQNAAEFLKVSAETLLGTRLDQWISEQAVHDIRNRLAILSSTGSERLYGIKLLKGKKASFDLALHFAGDLLVLEGEPSQPDSRMEAASMVRAMIARLNSARNFDAFHRDAARQTRAITGFDRVMIYRFNEGGSGEVIADSVNSGVESFLGLNYPASDIPVQARALYLRNPFRIIADVNAAPSPIDPPPSSGVQPLDLSLAVTRAVSPVHIEYLTNMGVGSSLSISIIVDGRLWGLIACHHQTPRLPSFVMRTAAELFGQMYSLSLESRLHHEAFAEEQRVRGVSDRLITAIAGDAELLSNAQWLQDISREIVTCDGVAIYRAGEVFANGSTPPDAEVRALAEKLNLTSPSKIFSTDHLASLHAPCADTADRASGLLAIPISRTPRDYIMLFRRERIHEVKWGGEPAKALIPSDDGMRISPRKSFRAFAELIRGRAISFSERDRRVGEAIRLAMIEVILRLSESATEARRNSDERQDLLIGELNHRVRNILALIRGLITQTGQSATDVSTYVDGLNGRVQSLARAHDQITRHNWGPASIASLFDDEVAAHCPGDGGRFVFEGPSILLLPAAITTLALVIHELVTNSVKHGSLSGTGRIFVTVEVDHTTGGIWLRWRERGGPAVRAPERRGFGSAILERAVPFDLQGKASIRYALAGLEADFFIPSPNVWSGPLPPISNEPEPGDIAMESTWVGPVETPLAGRLVLLVEDNMLIAMETEDMLTSLGASSVVTVSNLADAADALAGAVFDLAVLDISVGKGTSFDFATRLKDAGVPYIFASGYGDQVVLDPEHSSAVVIQKPYSRAHLAAAVRRYSRPLTTTAQSIGAQSVDPTA